MATAAASNSLVQPGTGGVPIGASAVWVMAAAARREGGVSDTAPLPSASAAAISNTAPVIMNPTVGVPKSSTGKVTGKVVAADADKDKLKYAVTGPAGKGSVKVSASTGAFTYTPTAAARHAAARLGAPGSATVDSFTVTVSDGKGASASQTVSVIVAPKNTIPRLSVRVGKPAAGTAIVTGTVTARDSDKDTLTFSAPTKTDKGTVVVNASTGAFTYTPTQAARVAAGDRSAPSTSKTDTFDVTVSDGYGGSVSKSVKVTIAPANAAPTQGKATVTKTDSGTGVVSGTLSAVDANGDKITYSGPGSTSKGTVVVKGSTFTYTPTAVARHAASATTASEADKRDTFTITASDGKGGALPIAVTVSVAPKNAELGSPKTTVGQPNTSTGVVEGSVTATDPDGDTIKYSVASSTGKGSVIVNSASGAFVYQPSESAARQAGLPSATAADKQDSFTISLDDGHGSTRQVSVTVAIVGRNTPPAAGAVNVGSPDGNAVVTGSVTASDANGDALTFAVGANPGKGTVSVAANGQFTYTPNASARQVGVASTDTFTVNVSDGKDVTAIAVTVPVAALPASDTLNAGQWLVVGQFLQSSQGRYRLYMQGDGNLVLYDEGQNHKALWASGTNGQPGLGATMQSDGNVVLYAGTTAKWSTRTNGWNGARLVVQNDGNLVIYAGPTAVWDRHAGVLRNPGPTTPPTTPPTPGRAVGAKRNYNAGVAGNCTWGAYQKWFEATGYYPALAGDAGNWANSARAAGWTVVLDAQPRSIVVFTPALAGNSVGHVAWVTSTERRADGLYINIIEMNSGWNGGGFNRWNTRTTKDVVGMSYILAP